MDYKKVTFDYVRRQFNPKVTGGKIRFNKEITIANLDSLFESLRNLAIESGNNKITEVNPNELSVCNVRIGTRNKIPLLKSLIGRYFVASRNDFIPIDRVVFLFSMFFGWFSPAEAAWFSRVLSSYFETARRKRRENDPEFYWCNEPMTLPICILNIKLVNIEELRSIENDKDLILRNTEGRISAPEIEATIESQFLYRYVEEEPNSHVYEQTLYSLFDKFVKLLGYKHVSFSHGNENLRRQMIRLEDHQRDEKEPNIHYGSVYQPSTYKCFAGIKLINIQELENESLSTDSLDKIQHKENSSAGASARYVPSSQRDEGSTAFGARARYHTNSQNKYECSAISVRYHPERPELSALIIPQKEHKNNKVAAVQSDVKITPCTKDINSPNGLWTCPHAKDLPENYLCCPYDGKSKNFYSFDAKTLDLVSSKIAELVGSSNPLIFYDFVKEAKSGSKKWLKLNTCRPNNFPTSDSKKDEANRIFVITDDLQGIQIANKFEEISFLFSYLNEYYKFENKPELDKRTPLQKEIDKLYKYQENNTPSRDPLPASIREMIFEESNGKCFCCDHVITRSHFKVGHILSVKHGGSSQPDNLVAVCSACNEQMGTMHLFEFKILQFGASKYQPNDSFYRFYLTYRLYDAQVKGINRRADGSLICPPDLTPEYQNKVKEIFDTSNAKKYPFYLRAELLLRLL